MIGQNDQPAFPAMHFDLADNEHGMTLRDFFAAKAMQAYMANEVWRPEVFKLAAQSAYQVADAMIKERQK